MDASLWSRFHNKNNKEKDVSIINTHFLAIADASRAAHYAALKAIEKLKIKNHREVDEDEDSEDDETEISEEDDDEEEYDSDEKLTEQSESDFEAEDEDESETEDSSVEFEINEDFMEFYKKSLQYKSQKQNEEKYRLKQIAEGKEVDYVQGEQVKSYQKPTSIKPPLEMSSIKRDEELKLFYGSQNANRIQIAETQLQMEYDRNLDIHQPVYWPSLPLRL